MNDAAKALAKLKKANKLIQLAFRKNGPRCFKRGQGALLNSLLACGGETDRDTLIQALGCDRGELKSIVKKAARNGYVEFVENEEHGYGARLTEVGRSLAERRDAANDRCADSIVDCLSAEEVAQLNAITEKLVLCCKAQGVNAKKKGRKYGLADAERCCR